MAPNSHEIHKLREQRLQDLWPTALVNGVEIPNLEKGWGRGAIRTGDSRLSDVKPTNIGIHLHRPNYAEKQALISNGQFAPELNFPRIGQLPLEIKLFWLHCAYDFKISVIGISSEVEVTEGNLGFWMDQNGRASQTIEVKFLHQLEVGISWLLIAATSVDGDDIKVFFPVIVGNWDGIYPEERDAAKQLQTAQDSHGGFFKTVFSRPISPPVLTMDLPRHLTSHFSRIKQEVLDQFAARDREHQEQVEFARSNGKLIEFRIEDLELDLPRFPNDDVDFEMICADWLKAWGHEGAEVTQKSGDYGIDVFSHTAVGQAKFLVGQKIGRPAIQNLNGAALAFPNRRVVFFAFASGYTNEAIEWANETKVALLKFDTRSATFIASNQLGELFVQSDFS